MKNEKYILKTAGITVTGTMTPTGQWSCAWNPPPPYSPAIGRQILKNYIPWRDAAFTDYARRTGKRVMVIDI